MSNEMPPALKTKLANRALEAKRNNRSVRRPWLVGVMTAGLAVMAVSAFFLLPKPALGKTWSMITDAVDQARSFQIQIHTNKKTDAGQEPEDVLIAVSEDKMMVNAGPDGLMYMSGDTMQVYDKNENKIMRIKMPISGLGQMMPGLIQDSMKAFNLKDELANYEKKYGKDHIRIQPVRLREGREVFDVVMTEPEGPGTVHMTVDAATNLPTDINVSDLENGKLTDTTITLRYNDQIVIDPKFPEGAKIEDLDLSKLTDLKKDGKNLEKEIKASLHEGFESFAKGK